MKVKPEKYTFKDVRKINLGTKTIFKYPTSTKTMDVARMVVKGRHPEGKNKFVIEHDCSFAIYVINGKGKVYAGDQIYMIKPRDVVFVPKENKFAVEGNMEYITFDSPVFYVEQSEQVEGKLWN